MANLTHVRSIQFSHFKRVHNQLYLMQFLKKKAASIYQYSKGLITKASPTVLNGKATLEVLLGRLDEETSPAALQRLAALSTEFQEYTDIFNFLIGRLQEFAYKAKSIKQTLKLLNISVFLIKAGSEEFAGDFKKNEDLLSSLEKVNTHQFENCISVKDAKMLTYRLELIRHRATYIKKLVNSPQLCEAERTRNTLPASVLEAFKSQAEGDQTINGLKIDVSFDKPAALRQRKQEKENFKEQSDCKLTIKSVSPLKPGAVLGNRISNEIAT